MRKRLANANIWERWGVFDLLLQSAEQSDSAGIEKNGDMIRETVKLIHRPTKKTKKKKNLEHFYFISLALHHLAGWTYDK